MQSSPVAMVESEMWMLRDDSGLMPSVLGEPSGLSMVTPRTTTPSQYTGWMVQNGGFLMVTSVIARFLQSSIWISGGRRKPSSIRRRSSGQSPRSGLRRANSCCHFERVWAAPGFPI